MNTFYRNKLLNRPSPATGNGSKLVQSVPFSFFLFWCNIQNRTRPRLVPPAQTFFRKFLNVSKRSPLQFLWCFETEQIFKKSQRVPLLHFFALWDCSKFSSFCLILGFLNIYSIFFAIVSEFWRRRFKNIAPYPNFQRYIRTILRFTKEEAELQKQALPFVPRGYIQTFDVISQVTCLLTEAYAWIKRSHLSQHSISELREHKRHPSGVSKPFS